MSEQNKRVLRRFFREVWTEGNLELVDVLFARDWLGHGPLSQLGEPEALKQLIAVQRAAYPDLRITVEAQIAEGDMVATRWTACGTHQGEPGTSKIETSSGMTLARLACGKIVEDWTSGDALGLLQQTGIVTRPEPSGHESAPETPIYKETVR